MVYANIGFLNSLLSQDFNSYLYGVLAVLSPVMMKQCMFIDSFKEVEYVHQISRVNKQGTPIANPHQLM